MRAGHCAQKFGIPNSIDSLQAVGLTERAERAKVARHREEEMIYKTASGMKTPFDGGGELATQLVAGAVDAAV